MYLVSRVVKPSYLLELGILCLLLSLYLHTQMHTIDPKSLNNVFVSTTNNQPIQIKIPKLNIQDEIIPGGIKGQDWILSDSKIMYLPTSGLLGEGYNTVIYAHKRPGLFLDLNQLTLGDKIYLYNKIGRQFIYSVKSKQTVDPNNLSSLYSAIPNTLTLFTCDGFFDQHRLVVRANIQNFDYNFPILKQSIPFE